MNHIVVTGVSFVILGTAIVSAAQSPCASARLEVDSARNAKTSAMNELSSARQKLGNARSSYRAACTPPVSEYQKRRCEQEVVSCEREVDWRQDRYYKAEQRLDEAQKRLDDCLDQQGRDEDWKRELKERESAGVVIAPPEPIVGGVPRGVPVDVVEVPEEVPARPDPPHAPNPAVAIELPTGKVLEFSSFEQSARTEAADSLELPINYPGGDQPFAILNVHKTSGKLHGPCTAHHENGSLMLVGRYLEGNRDGAFRWMSAKGENLLDAQFRNGREHGFICFYQHGKPVLVQECVGGAARWSHRLEDRAVLESVEHTSTKPAEVSEAMEQLLGSYTAFARELRKNEHKIKEMVRDIVDDVRRQRAAERGVLTTQMMMQRMGERAAADAAVINSLRSHSGF